MGYFTWTDARYEKPKLNRYGDFASSDVINYGRYAKVVCPDDTEIVEPHYDGYGIFDGKDVYELVVDWNKAHLKEIYETLEKENPNFWGLETKWAAIAFQNDDEKALQEAIDNLAEMTSFYREDWKRTIGITISCERNDKIPYPIKITKKKWHCKYNELYPSISTQ